MTTQKISCLPIAGLGNPYQHLMMEGLKKDQNLIVQYGKPGKFFAIFWTAAVQRPDYIHVDWLNSYYIRRTPWLTWLLFPLFIAQVWIARYVLGVRFVWTMHNLWPHDLPRTGPYKWSRQYFGRICEWIRVFDASTVDRAVAILRVSASKFRVVPEGDYTSYYPNTVGRTEARARLGIAEEEKVLLYLGLIKPYKGVLELVTLFRQIRPDQKLRLIIAGKAMDNAYMASVRQQITEEMIIKDAFVDDADLQVYYNAADAVILPFQRIENSGSVILAMGFKKTIIAPRIGVLEKRLAQQHELLYPLGQVHEGLNIFTKLTESRLKEIGQSNFEALKKYKWEDFSQCFY
jgi:beta-1,4-mannosyltransferase